MTEKCKLRVDETTTEGFNSLKIRKDITSKQNNETYGKALEKAVKVCHISFNRADVYIDN